MKLNADTIKFIATVCLNKLCDICLTPQCYDENAHKGASQSENKKNKTSKINWKCKEETKYIEQNRKCRGCNTQECDIWNQKEMYRKSGTHRWTCEEHDQKKTRKENTNAQTENQIETNQKTEQESDKICTSIEIKKEPTDQEQPEMKIEGQVIKQEKEPKENQ